MIKNYKLPFVCFDFGKLDFLFFKKLKNGYKHNGFRAFKSRN